MPAFHAGSTVAPLHPSLTALAFSVVDTVAVYQEVAHGLLHYHIPQPVRPLAGFHVHRLEANQDQQRPVLTPWMRRWFYDLTLVTTGDLPFRFFQHEQRLTGGTLQAVPPGSLVRAAADAAQVQTLRGYALYFRPELLQTHFEHPVFLRDFPFFQLHAPQQLFPLTAAQASRVAVLFDQLTNEYEAVPRRLDFDEWVQEPLWELLREVRTLYHNAQPLPEGYVPGRTLDVALAFEQLVHRRVRQRESVAALADRLYLSPKHVSECVKAVTGLTAKDYAVQALVQEAQALLDHPGTAVKVVASFLRFASVQQFSHFFHHHTGQWPDDYRRNPPVASLFPTF